MDALREFMDANDMKQADLARRLNVSEEAVSLFVNGKRQPSDGFRLRFVQAFGLDEYRRVFQPAAEVVA